jgi:hypothetical protein
VGILRHAWRSRQQPLWHAVALSPLYPVCSAELFLPTFRDDAAPMLPFECTSAPVASVVP